MSVVHIPVSKDKLVLLLQKLREKESKMPNRMPTKDWLVVVNQIRNVMRSLKDA